MGNRILRYTNNPTHIAGYIDAENSQTQGSGFSATYEGDGVFSIKLDTYDRSSVIFVKQVFNSSDGVDSAYVRHAAPTDAFDFQIVTTVGGARGARRPFNFIYMPKRFSFPLNSPIQQDGPVVTEGLGAFQENGARDFRGKHPSDDVTHGMGLILSSKERGTGKGYSVAPFPYFNEIFYRKRSAAIATPIGSATDQLTNINIEDGYYNIDNVHDNGATTNYPFSVNNGVVGPDSQQGGSEAGYFVGFFDDTPDNDWIESRKLWWGNYDNRNENKPPHVSVKRQAEGVFSVDFDRPMKSRPVVIATAHGQSGINDNALVASTSKNGFVVKTTDKDYHFADRAFSFLVAAAG